MVGDKYSRENDWKYLREVIIMMGIENNHSNHDSSGADVLKQIEKLAALKESGIITEEFDQKKASFLEKI